MFIKRLAALIGVATSAKELATLAPEAPIYVCGIDPYADDLPGIGVQFFKVIMNRDWFVPGDVLSNGKPDVMFHIRKKTAEYDVADVITNDPNLKMVIHFYDEASKKGCQVEQVRRICSTYGEFDHQPS